ncbi:MAG TPA: homoserine dehydrogenase [Clostridiaceae bacterium]|nr:homoserine dehydrogenase [Clostridiaceae bacterium]
MINIGILGFGVVGSGVAEVIAMNLEKLEKHLEQPIRVKRILDVRDFDDSPFSDLLTKDADVFFNDTDISVVVETIGGVGIAYEFTSRALSQGKSVVTSNKELVATHGVELLQLAKDNHCAYFFEAAVGGGIPIIRPLHRCLAANRITKIAGIVNGTTNYILTQMELSDMDFSDALSRAQLKGYAESNPAADIEGIDAQRKIAILSSIAMNGIYINPDQIHTEGIKNVGVEDMTYARALGAKIKLLAIYKSYKEGSCEVIVAPHLVDRSEPISVADGVFNAIAVDGNALGPSMFYGKGAGKLATASAVVADVLDAALHQSKNAHIMSWTYPEHTVIKPFEDMHVIALVRLKGTVDLNLYRRLFPNQQIKPVVSAVPQETAFVVGQEGTLTEKMLSEATSQIKEFISLIRIYS